MLHRDRPPRFWGTPRPPFFAFLLLLTLLSACGTTPAPTAPPTAGPVPTVAATAQPTVLPPVQGLTPTANLTAAPGAGEFALTFYKLVLDYDPARWQVVPGPTQEQILTSSDIPSCTIREQGPTEPPALAARVTLGRVVYQQSDEIPVGNGVVERWYLATGGSATPTPAGIPVLRVTAPVDDKIACFEAAEQVLATLHAPGE